MKVEARNHPESFCPKEITVNTLTYFSTDEKDFIVRAFAPFPAL